MGILPPKRLGVKGQVFFRIASWDEFETICYNYLMDDDLRKLERLALQGDTHAALKFYYKNVSRGITPQPVEENISYLISIPISGNFYASGRLSGEGMALETECVISFGPDDIYKKFLTISAIVRPIHEPDVRLWDAIFIYDGSLLTCKTSPRSGADNTARIAVINWGKDHIRELNQMTQMRLQNRLVGYHRIIIGLRERLAHVENDISEGIVKELQARNSLL